MHACRIKLAYMERCSKAGDAFQETPKKSIHQQLTGAKLSVKIKLYSQNNKFFYELMPNTIMKIANGNCDCNSMLSIHSSA